MCIDKYMCKSCTTDYTTLFGTLSYFIFFVYHDYLIYYFTDVRHMSMFTDYNISVVDSNSYSA